MRDRSWPSGALLAEFGDADALLDAVRSLRTLGYAELEAYTPYPVPGLADALGFRRSRLPRVVFGCGLLGALASYAIQWYANVFSYPLNIGGRPAHAVPAFIVPTFEGTVLCASLGAFIGLFVILRLPTPWHPVFEVDGFERASIDRYWLAIDLRDRHATGDAARSVLDALGPLRVLRV